LVSLVFVGHRFDTPKKDRCETDVYVELTDQCLKDCAGSIGEKAAGACSHVCGETPPDYEEQAELARGHL